MTGHCEDILHILLPDNGDLGVPLYKYLPRQYADILLVMGGIRVGTLFDFRKMEHARGVADPSEGTKSILARPNRDIITEDRAEKDAFFKMTGIKVNGNITVPRGVRFVHNQTSSDYFIFCTSTELSSRVKAEFESADACIEINDINGFLDEMTRTLNTVIPVRFLGIHEVQYTKRNQHQSLTQFQDFNYTRGHPPALIKDPSFRQQKEVRAIWSPISAIPLKPINILSLHLPQYCRDASAHIA